MLSRHSSLVRTLSAVRILSSVMHVPRATIHSKHNEISTTRNLTNHREKPQSNTTMNNPNPDASKPTNNARPGFPFRSRARQSPAADKATESPPKPHIDSDALALLNRIETLEQDITSGKRVKTEHIEKCMRDCILMRQYLLVGKCFVLFDKEYYRVKESRKTSVAKPQQDIEVNPPAPSYTAYIASLYAAAVTGNVQLAEFTMSLLSAEKYDLAEESMTLDWLSKLDDSVWQGHEAGGRINLVEALNLDCADSLSSSQTSLYLATGKSAAASSAASPIGHVASLLMLLSRVMAGDSKSAAVAATTLPARLLAEAPQLYLPLIVDGLYRCKREHAVAGFLDAAANAGAVLNKPLLDALVAVASLHEHRLHVMAFFDSYFAGAATAQDVPVNGEAPHNSLKALSITLAKCKPVGALLWERQEAIMKATDDPAQQLWLQLSLGDAGLDVAGEEYGWFSMTGAHLLPLLHAYACRSLTDGVPAGTTISTLFPPSREVVIEALQAMRGLPGPFWYAVERASPVLWRETLVLSEVAAQLGYNDKYSRSVAVQSCMNARKPMQVLYLCERMLLSNTPIRIRLASDVCTFLGATYIPALPLSIAAATQSVDASAAAAAAMVENGEAEGAVMMRGSGPMAWELCTRALKEPITDQQHLMRRRLGLDSNYYANHFTADDWGASPEVEEDENGQFRARKLTPEGLEGMIASLLVSDGAFRVAALLCTIAGVNIQKTFSESVAKALTKEVETPGFGILAAEMRAACLAGFRKAGARVVRGSADTQALLLQGVEGMDRMWSAEFAVIASKETKTRSRSESKRPPVGFDLADPSFFETASQMSTIQDASPLHPHLEVLPQDWLRTMWGRTIMVLATQTTAPTPPAAATEKHDAAVDPDAIPCSEESSAPVAPPDALLHARAAVELWSAAQLAPLPSLHTATAHTGVLAALARVRASDTLLENLSQLLAPTEERVAAYVGAKYGDLRANRSIKGGDVTAASESVEAEDADGKDESEILTSASAPKRPKRRRNKPKLSLEFIHNAAKDRRTSKVMSEEATTRAFMRHVGSGAVGIREQIQHVYARAVEAVCAGDVPRASALALYETAARRFHWPLLQPLRSNGRLVDGEAMKHVSWSDVVATLPLNVPLDACEPSPLPLALLREGELVPKGLHLLDLRRCPMTFAECALALALTHLSLDGVDSTMIPRSRGRTSSNGSADKFEEPLILLVDASTWFESMPLLSGTCDDATLRIMCHKHVLDCTELYRGADGVVLSAVRIRR